MTSPYSLLTPRQHELYDMMSEISEECYCAGWMDGNEFTLWEAIQTGEMRYGMGNIDKEKLAKVAALSVLTGCWIIWKDKEHGLPLEEHGPYAIPIAEWIAIYNAINSKEAQ